MFHTRRLPRLLTAAALAAALALPAALLTPAAPAEAQQGTDCAAQPRGSLRRFFCEQQAAGRKVLLRGYQHEVVAAEAEYVVLALPSGVRTMLPYASILMVELGNGTQAPVLVLRA